MSPWLPAQQAEGMSWTGPLKGICSPHTSIPPHRAALSSRGQMKLLLEAEVMFLRPVGQGCGQDVISLSPEPVEVAQNKKGILQS